MTEHYVIGLLAGLTILIPVVQHFRVKKLIPQFKSLQVAIEHISKELESSKVKLADTESLLAEKTSLVSDLEEKALEALDKEKAAQAKSAQLVTAIAEHESGAKKARESFIEANNKLNALKSELENKKAEVTRREGEMLTLQQEIQSLQHKMENLLTLQKREKSIQADIENLRLTYAEQQNSFGQAKLKFEGEIQLLERKLVESKNQLSATVGKLDLYSRVDEFTQVGHFEMPNYLYDTSVRYQSEIKEIREQQKRLIKEKNAVTYPGDLTICSDKSLNKRILDGQVVLMLSAFNVECDLLIEKVGPSNLDRTLEQIERKAEQLEKNCATLRCGFNIDYVELKFEECKLQYEYTLKKKEEQEEQRLIREQMKEEVRVQKQYEEAMKEAEKEELKYRRLIEKAREHLNQETEQERALTLAKISLLEEQLREAEERGIRAKSMAEQTRRGFVYVISNIGAFGEGVYKIGLTRRLDPQERVDELGDASVPFPFDVHAMCFSEDAPSLENALHKRFASRRVNAVNLRKEFFRVSLEEIQEAVEDLVGTDVEFKITARAEDYYESKRLVAA
ncbi:DUF4041 domain-containing protein [Noviherbaspirillum malthae]|uniref:DUF4041 domain-containing protein n=1 Tax=Noviherbaspirillum malthae TaxID=1260987 RepID=UPI001E5A1CA5